MKKYIFIIIAAAFAMSTQTASAQGKAITMAGSDAVTDTITNAGTTYLTSPSLAAYASGAVSISLKTTNVSGTSTFKAILQGSHDGTNWVNVHGVAGTNGINCDTLQVTSAAPAYWISNIAPGSVKSVTDSTFLYTGATRYLFIRWTCVGTGTQSTIISGKVVPYED